MQTAIDFTGIDFSRLKFDGADINPHRDNKRLGQQMERIIELMKDEKWRIMKEISTICQAPEASVSAQLRHLRKERFGGHTVNRRHLGFGLYEYQLILKKDGMF
jgi:hypothetical protein